MKQTSGFKTWLGWPALVLLAVAVTAAAAKAPTTPSSPGTARVEDYLGARASDVRLSTPAIAPQLSAATDFALPWYSFNGGGVVAGASPTQGLTESIGQPVAGRGQSSAYALDMGFLAGSKVCNCPHQGDINEDGFVDALDLGSMIDILFAGKPDLRDVNCPTTRVDFHCDGFSDMTDLGSFIDYMFVGGAPPCNPCTEF